MKLLILTQKVDINDDVLGFFHRWIEEFAKHCEKITVICLQKGEYDLPENVKVLSLGKENSLSKVKPWNLQGLTLERSKRLKYLFNFYKYIWRERKNYDMVFIHMNHGYIIYGGLLWKLLGKKIGLWYAHGYVPFSLKIAEKISDIIFTSTEGGFRLASGKKKVVGQGIDIEKFTPSNGARKAKVKSGIEAFKIITIGRISPVKDYETLIKAAEIVVKQKRKIDVDIIGGAGLPEQEQYLNDLKKIVSDKSLGETIKFAGSIANKDVIDHLRQVDLFVNMSLTGSLDKAILEAMACEVPVLTCNESATEILGKYGDLLVFGKGDSEALAEKIISVMEMSEEEKEELGKGLREMVVENHGIAGLIEKIIREFSLFGKK